MVILHFTMCGISVKRGWLFGDRSNPTLHTVNLLILRAHILSSGARSKMFTAMRGLCSDPLWMIENHESILAAKNDAIRTARREFGERNDQEIERLSKQLTKTRDENMRLITENRTLRRAIEIVERGE